MKAYDWDKRLKIKTDGRDDYHADNYHYPYEPTPYSVLERFAESGYVGPENVLVDYGCGKGRVSFFLKHVIGCDVIGVEYDERIHQQALRNLETYAGKGKLEFICADAGNFEVNAADCFYFFNPFSVEVLRTVLGRIVESYYDEPRHMQLFFYYPEDEYLAYLMSIPELMFVDEIDCQDLFVGNNRRERLVVFEMSI